MYDIKSTEVNSGIWKVVVTNSDTKETIAKTHVIGNQTEAEAFVQDVLLMDIRRELGIQIELPIDSLVYESITDIDGIEVYWYDASGRPRFSPMEYIVAYDDQGRPVYGYSETGDNLYGYTDELLIDRSGPEIDLSPKALEVVDGIPVYYYSELGIPVFTEMTDILDETTGAKGYTLSGEPLYGYDDYGNILYTVVGE